MTDLRISRESSKLISSLDSDFRYIKFVKSSDSHYFAVICSQITDDELSTVLDGQCNPWIFDDVKKGIRSLRRLNKEICIYSGVFSLEQVIT
ncbi:MAG: hypothetical protein [Inoviridae sp.]|nr:MAG: hypothetical protein [Inoviridae sp.]